VLLVTIRCYIRVVLWMILFWYRCDGDLPLVRAACGVYSRYDWLFVDGWVAVGGRAILPVSAYNACHAKDPTPSSIK
jgi:hypothetical protein